MSYIADNSYPAYAAPMVNQMPMMEAYPQQMSYVDPNYYPETILSRTI